MITIIISPGSRIAINGETITMQTKSKPKKVSPITPTEKSLRKKLKEKELQIEKLEEMLRATISKLEVAQREGRRLAEEAYAGMQLKRALLEFLPR